MSSGFKNPMPAQTITPGGRNEAIATMAANNATQAKLVNVAARGGSRRRYGGFTAKPIQPSGLPPDVTARQQGLSNQSQAMFAAGSVQASGDKVGGKRNRRKTRRGGGTRRTKKQKRNRHKTPRNRTHRNY